jgi:hypothetical protein
MPAMRHLAGAVLVLLAAGCGRDPDPPPPPPPPAPLRPIVNRAPLPAPQERIAFAREDGIWTVTSNGGDLQRVIPATCPGASEPVWAPDRRWIAFTAAREPELNLHPRNVFVARPDGSELRQVTPLPRAGLPAEDAPKGIVRGRAVFVTDVARRPLPRLHVTAMGLRRPELTDADGNFQTYLPVGGGWVKIAGDVDGRRAVAWRFAATAEGRITELKDIPLTYGEDETPSAPAWTADGRQIVYVLRRGTRTTLRRIGSDGGGDETVLSFPEHSILAGPVVRGDSAWCKMSDGRVLCIDLKLKTVVDALPSAIAAPDALAVSPDGRTVATITMEPTGARAIVLLRRNWTQTLATFRAGDPAPRAMDFSPDGGRLVLDRHDAVGRSALWILTIADGKLAPLVDPGSSPVWHGR